MSSWDDTAPPCRRAVALVLMALVALASPAAAQVKPANVAPDLDARGAVGRALAQPPAALSAPQAEALEGLRKAAPALRLRWSALTGAPSRISGLYVALPADVARGPQGGARRFVEQHRALFGLSAEEVSALALTVDFATAHNGVRHLAFQQRVEGVDVFGGRIKLNVTRDGRVINVSGEPVPDAHAAINASAPDLGEAAAIEKAAAAAGVRALRASRSQGLLYFPLAPGQLRLAWDVTVEDAATPNMYRTLVDAVDGRVLWRKNLTLYSHFNSRGLVYPDEGPIANTPTGTSTGIVNRVDTPFDGRGFFPHDDPHFDWWNGSGEANRNTTRSNNVRAKQDRDGDNDDSEGFFTTTGENFNPPIDLTMDPSNSQNAAITNLFYWNNHLHDVFYRLGFDEASGNFQSDNFGLGGSGGDPVQADAQDNRDGATPSLCNANFGTPGDGASPRMQMYQCNFNSPERDGDLDNPVIVHEYGHGVHSRLVPTSGMQAGNEGWADYFALSLLARPGENIEANYELGWWLFGFGIRRQPYSTDQSVFTRTYADIVDGAACQLGTCSNSPTTSCGQDADCGAGNSCNFVACSFHTDCDSPPQPVDLGLCAPEIHNTGELWAEALWLLRTNLVRKVGFASGGRTSDQLVIDGMKLSPDDPDFLDGRDAILDADVANNDGANQCLIWNAFARMGMGVSALSGGVMDINPVEGFDTPSTCTPNIQVSASTAFGNVCRGSFNTLALQVSNNGTGDLLVKSVARISGSSDITVDPLPATPVYVGSGSHLDFTVRCQPSSTGAKTAVIRVSSDDPDQPQIDLTYTCTAPPGDIEVSGSGAFGTVCAGAQAEKTISVCNTGLCAVSVTNAFLSRPGAPHVADCDDFTIVNNPFPAEVGKDFCVPLTVVFTPTTTGPRSCDLVIQSNDPDENPVIIPVSGETPSASIAVPPDQAFAPEVIQSVAACDSRLPFPISNTGSCPLTVTGVAITTNAAEFALSGLPSVPATIPAGHILGEGDLQTVFAPDALDRDALGVLSVTYVSNPVTGDTTTVNRNLCGEGTLTGARVLVTAGGVPLPTVDKIHLQRIVGNRKESQDVVSDAPLTTVTPAGPCTAFQYHREYGSVANPIMLVPGNYQVTVQARVAGHNVRRTVFFDVTACDFNRNIAVDF